MFMPRLTVLTLTLLTCGALAADAPVAPTVNLPAPASHRIDFAREIKPIFEASCIQCHAKGKDKGGFNLETREAFLKGGDDGPAVVPGDSAKSSIVQLVATSDPDSVMPKKGTKLKAEEIGLLRAWIDQGMPWDPSITFAKPESLNLKPREVALPSAGGSHPVDRLLAEYFAVKHIEPAPVAEDRVFCRRAYLDVIGLLPTAQQLGDFLSDTGADKRSKLVRQLLDDRRGYADHWLTFWNDLLRNDYRGTGFIDGGRRQISGWLYGALVENMPYDRFVANLVNPTKTSEGFSRGIIWRGSVNASMLPPIQAAQNISQVFLGVNLKCASCHDSFVSNWTLADAYGLAAVYSDDTLELIHCDKPTGKTASPRFLYPQVGAIDPSAPKSQRLETLAKLMTSASDGRLSRTIVNRLWARLVGRGLVEPLDDMERASWNSDLLDWLAEDLVAHHYDLKHTIEVILTSQAYQMPTIDLPASDGKQEYVFRGPTLRRLTAEQFCDAVTSLTGDWPRFPSTINIDFSAGNLIGPVKAPQWIWTDEPVEIGHDRLAEQLKKKPPAETTKEEPANKDGKVEDPKPEAKETPKDLDSTKKPADAEPADPPAADKDKSDAPTEPLARHKVVFRKELTLAKVPGEAFAAASASQGFSIIVNGKLARPFLSDSERNGRDALFDLKRFLIAGKNVVVIDVASHTEKKLNDAEKHLFPVSRNHVNTVSGLGFYLRCNFAGGEFTELTSDDTWRVRRAPQGKWKEAAFDDGEWSPATKLPDGVAPVDEGPSLPPVTRKDFANEAIELAIPLHNATTTAAQPGGIRASLLAADPLMTALDRPNREQVMTSRSSAATTLQTLELTNGKTFDGRLKQAAQKLAPTIAKDPSTWIAHTYEHLLSRPPSDMEKKIAMEVLGEPVKPEGVADFLWGLTLLPEFQFIN
jgi:mono/diheme cytochrome c family protein